MAKTKKKEVQKQGLRPSQKAKAEKLRKKQEAKLVSASPSLQENIVDKTEQNVVIDQASNKSQTIEPVATITVKNAEGESDTIAEILIQNKIDYIPKVSVVMPVYNVEPYLRQCLDSVISQTLKEIEIICVDDGSTDNSLNILKEYAAKDNRITLFAPGHIGTGHCRNIALSVVQGEWIGFVDPDDWIEGEYFEKLYNSASRNTDIVFQTSRIETYWREGKEVVIDTPTSQNDYVFRFNTIHYSAHLWSKIFRRSYVEKYNLKNSFTKRSQDLLFTFPALLLAKNIKCINHAKYYYRKGQKSACTVEYTARDATEVFALYKQIESKIKQFDENMLSLVKYKKNITLKKMYTTSDDDVQRIIRENAKDLYETDFDISEKGQKKIVIKNPAFNTVDKLWWGDYWLGLDLAQGLKKQGFGIRIDYAEDEVDSNFKINIVIRGIHRNIKLNKGDINVLYLISHPDDVSLKEVNQYNLVIVGSKKKCEYFKKYGVKAYYLPQFTNSKRFFHEKNDAFKTKLLFVGNAYDGVRPAVQYATNNDLPISIYGKFWDKYIDKKYIKGEYIDNNDLRKYYSNAEIVLNDTNENMKTQGFVSNRIYDATVCKAFIISDYMPEIEDIYGDAIPMYRNEEEFCKLVNYYLSHPEDRKTKAKQAYDITIKHYTNNVFADNLSHILNKYSFFLQYLSLVCDYILFPYNVIKLQYLKKLISPDILERLSFRNTEQEEQKLKKDKENVLKKTLSLLLPVRIDIKNNGNYNNDLIVTADACRITTPAYYTNDKGVGYVVEYSKLFNTIKLKIIHDGTLQINFKTQDKRYEGCKYHFWINYKSIRIDGKELLSNPISAWHDKPFRYQMAVKHNQEITIDIENSYYAYSKGELIDIIEKFGKEPLEKLDLYQLIQISKICADT